MTVETTTLAPGHEISRILRGGWQLAGGHGPVERERAIADMFAFLDAGITAFDCADISRCTPSSSRTGTTCRESGGRACAPSSPARSGG
jgi:aryl-alcohol dehydrogenase-like predicted oxidoreductase